MWRNTDTPPLDQEERARVYCIQCALGARKLCRRCGETKPVAEFAGYLVSDCTACLEDLSLEAWWSMRKLAAGIVA